MTMHRSIVVVLFCGALGCTSLDSAPPDTAQCSGASPQYCPALDDAPSGCFSSNTACETLVNCNGAEYSCSASGLVADCVATDCVPASTCALGAGADDTACTRCFVRKCCSTWGACEADSACVACIQAGSGTTCTNANYNALLSCGVTYCGTQCGATNP